MSKIIGKLEEFEARATSNLATAEGSAKDVYTGQLQAINYIKEYIQSENVVGVADMKDAFKQFKATKINRSDIMTFGNVFKKDLTIEEVEGFIMKFIGEKDV